MKERFQAGIWTQSCIYFSRTCISAIIEMVCIGYRALPFFFLKRAELWPFLAWKLDFVSNTWE